MIYDALWAVGLSNKCVTRESNSLMIDESLVAVRAVESMRHP